VDLRASHTPMCELVAVFEEGLEVRVLAEIGLDVGEALGDEVVEPLLAEVVIDPVNAVLSQRGRIIGRPPGVLHGPFGPFFPA
jgi:hypothetical protein